MPNKNYININTLHINIKKELYFYIYICYNVTEIIILKINLLKKSKE